LCQNVIVTLPPELPDPEFEPEPFELDELLPPHAESVATESAAAADATATFVILILVFP
jgi:hypothetical protein